MTKREYGGRGLAGILTPQSNTTVEAEFAVLMEPDVACASARLNCPSQDSRERLLSYWTNMRGTLAQFDEAPLDVAAFACTGSTYLVGLEAERAAFETIRPPVHSAAGATLEALRALGARRIAILSPYSSWLTEACVAFWQAQSLEVVEVASPPGERADSRAIYALRTGDALATLRKLDVARADAVLITGTGMPSLGAITQARLARPVVSSNLCLAWRVSQTFGRSAIEDWLAPDAGWRARYAARYPSLQ